MKMIKTLVCAMAASVAFALCASTSKAEVLPTTVVSNYSVLTFSLTIKTNITKSGTELKATKTIVSTKLVNKDILRILASPDFADTAFPSNAQIVIGWDQPWESHVLIVDKTGSNVLYDVTANNTTNVAFEIDLFQELGTESGSANGGNPGGENFTAYNNGYFNILDLSQGISIWGHGPSTESFSISWGTNGIPNKWSDSVTFTPQNGDQSFNGATGATMTGTITARGHGKGTPYDLYFRL